MRKRIVNPAPQTRSEPEPGRNWLDLEEIAAVEVTSEDSSFPVEAALLSGNESGWRASSPGKQSIRLHFDKPQRLQFIRLHFIEADNVRTQEFDLSFSNDNGLTYHEIVRQQWNFSPDGAKEEIEEYRVDFPLVTDIELKMNPDIADEKAFASLMAMRVA
jgi:hypothetical protein